MAEFDWVVGELLKKLDVLGIADNTIVVISTDNGAEVMTWPDGGNTPFHGEKGTTWEGGMRVPCVVRWPGVIKPDTVVNDVMSHEDWLPTFLAAAGDPEIKKKLKEGNLQDSVLRSVNMPYVINLRQDPYERFMRESKMYFRWYGDKLWTFVPAQTVVARLIATFKDFPPSQPSATFGPDQALQMLSSPAANR